MTNQEQNLIDAINDFELNQENIPVELIRAYSLLRDKFNKIRSTPAPIFTENNILIDMKYWDDHLFTGLNNWEFIRDDFYKEGFQTTGE
jgi:hypothetical protein